MICGDNNQLNRVYAHDCSIGNQNQIGPFVHLRPHTDIHDKIKIGNFVEVKNSVIDDGTKLPHHIYCGDADLGKNVNFGCGTVTVNFDGKNKYRTVVEEHAFIGCNTNLIAPIHIGKKPLQLPALLSLKMFLQMDWPLQEHIKRLKKIG